MCDKGSLPLVTVFDADIIVPPTNIEFGEVVSVFQLVHKVRDKGKGIDVSGSMLVEVLVVLARMQLAILFLNEEEGRGLGGVEKTNLSSG